jgi:hypothetical protein
MANPSAALSFLDATRKATDAVPSALRQAVAQAALATKTAIMSQPDYPKGPLRGTAYRGRPGRKVGVGYDIVGSVNPTALVAARGPFPLIERSTRSHFVGAGKVGKARYRSARARTVGGRTKTAYKYADAAGPRQYSGSRPLRINGNWRQGPWAHRGTRGKHVFEHGVEQARPITVQIFQRNFHSAMANNLAGVFRAS